MASAAAVRRFFRSPKGLLTIVLAILALAAAPGQGWARAGACLGAAIAAGAALDLVILRVRSGTWQFPSGAVLTGAIVAMVLSAHNPWHVAAATTAVAILSKYVLRLGTANMFNPAALALVAMFHVFNPGQDWWGALPEVAPALGVPLLLATGLFITIRTNKLPMTLAFLGVYYALFTGMAFAADPAHVAEIYRAPDLHAALYFAFIILTDPPTSPVKPRHQVICGVIVAVASFAVFEALGVVYFLLAGVLAGNIWEMARRWRVQRARYA